jgi:hypothetical protein
VAQKLTSQEVAKTMLEILASQVDSNFHFFFVLPRKEYHTRPLALT